MTVEYPFTIRPLSKKEGGGYLIEFPDLPGCVSDGETIEQAIENGKDAVKCWLAAAKKSNKAAINKSEMTIGKWVQRVPKTLHTRLTLKAKDEGISLNTLVISMISEVLGRREVNEKSKHL